MHTLPAELIAEAFALSNARGADLLVQLGNFGVWRGDLATMRGDAPRAESKSDSRSASLEVEFQEAFVLAKAIELLTPDCRSALAVAYSANGSDRSPDPVRRECERRLLEIYESLAPEYSAR